MIDELTVVGPALELTQIKVGHVDAVDDRGHLLAEVRAVEKVRRVVEGRIRILHDGQVVHVRVVRVDVQGGRAVGGAGGGGGASLCGGRC
jgi:hypothetical protein